VVTGEDLTAEEASFFADPTLDTAEAKHAAAVLLAHLRAIKSATGNGANHELNQANHYTAGPAAGRPFS